MATSPSKRCKRHGCLKEYVEEENHDEACRYHNGKPLFHDTKKGWTCCNQTAYDWDEFEKLVPCSIGKHSDEDQFKGMQGQEGFYKASTVENAKKALEKEESRNALSPCHVNGGVACRPSH
jgi:hypothetical protein